MKIKFGLILATMVSAVGMAEVITNAPVAVPPPDAAAAPPAATNSAASKPAHKSARKKHPAKPGAPKATQPARLEASPLVVNAPAVARQDHVNVRGQAGINSEIVTHLKQGETVLVLEEITLKHPKTDEPAKWARIGLPAGTHVWVSKTFLDAGQTVTPAKLKVRAGPGENYSFIGLLRKGETVKAVGAKGEWTEIEAPTNAYAFVAAHLLAHKEPGAAPVEPTPTPVTPPVQSAVTAPPPAAPPTTPTPEPAVPPPVTQAPAPTVTPPVTTPLPPTVEEPPAKRVVLREGVVGGTVSVQAPSFYRLRSLDNGVTMDYLYTTKTNLDLTRYRGLTVRVTGEEGLDERWPNTPVLTIETIQLAD